MGKNYFWRKTQKSQFFNISSKLEGKKIKRKKGMHWLGQGTQIDINEN